MNKLAIWVIFFSLAITAILIAPVIFSGLTYFFGPKIEYKYGLIDRTGKFIVKPAYDYLTDMRPYGTAKGYTFDPDSQDDWDLIYYLIDRNGNIEGTSKVNHNILNLREEGIQVFGSPFGESDKNFNPKLISAVQNHKYGYKNQHGQWIIQPKWDYATDFDKNAAFVYRKECLEGKWGLINTNGDYLLKPTCVAIWPFSEDLARCKVKLINGKF